jgi:starvation-inducible DNA-binding protein
LNRRLVDVLRLENAARMAHWNVRGRFFGPLHALFGEVYALMAATADRLAERAATLGAPVTANVAAVAVSDGEAYPVALASGDSHLGEVAARLRGLAGALRASVAALDEISDNVSSNMLTDIAEQVEKIGWKVVAHLEPSTPG